MNNTVIENNQKIYLDLYDKYILPNYKGAKQLREWIVASDFFTAPASALHHLAEKGGLCRHTLNVYYELEKQLKCHYGEDYVEKMGIDKGSVALVSLCHDLCKCHMYEIDYRNKKVYSETGTKFDNKGKFDWVSEECYVINEKFRFGHGAKSVFIVMNFIQGISLEEASAIRFHQGGFETGADNIVERNLTQVYDDFPLAFWTHMADMVATHVIEAQPTEIC